jgi:mRNA-degrading endonuclease RelE of RelBE toxin-antitoxin system
MHTVIETPTFLGDCRRARLPDDDRLAMVDAIAEDPFEGEIIQGTGGARKRRFGGRSKGKRGGYRVISYYAGDDVPVLVLALVDKGERADISKAERNMLRQELASYAAQYRLYGAVRRRRP